MLFLRNIIWAEGIGPDPDKVKTMLEFPVPINQKKLKTALGFNHWAEGPCIFGIFGCFISDKIYRIFT